jgi:cellulose synthase/poly-beta-1,6-N-acetylglucosamine synthase-like glycosyltransferase
VSVLPTILWLLAAAVLMPLAVFCTECLLSLPRRSKRARQAPAKRPRIAVVIPAHDEEQIIGQTVACVVGQLAPDDQLLVVADNCTDSTARVAAAAGAVVIERHDADRRGKGYALDFGISWLRRHPPQVVVFLDADCRVEEGCIESLAETVAESGRPAQAVYLLAPPAQPSVRDQLSALAFLVKNLVRPIGLRRMGGPCVLTGTGMAFPWQVIADAPLASGNIVEDMQLGVDLAIAGYPAILADAATVRGQLPQGAQIAATQRRRWEHGHLQTLLTQAPRLLGQALLQRRWDLLAMAMDLAVPPLALLVMLWALITAAAAAAWWLAGIGGPLLAMLGGGLLLLLAVVAAWARFGRGIMPARALLAVPLYVIWKLPLYAAFLFHREKAWVRTRRQEG